MIRIIIIACLAVILSGQLNAQSKLDISFANVSSGTIVLLDEAYLIKQKIAFENSKVSLSIPGEALGLYYLAVENYNDGRPIPLLLSRKNTVMQFETFIPVKESNFYHDLYPNIPSFTEDPNTNAVFYTFLKRFISFGDDIVNLSSDLKSDSLKQLRMDLYHSFINYCDSLIWRNQHATVSAVILNYLMANNLLALPDVQKLYNYLSKSARDSYSAYRVANEIAVDGRLKPGSLAPLFQFISLNGTRYDMDEIKNKKILLHFWSESCAPCLAEAPDIKRVSREFSGSLVIINVSQDRDTTRWKSGIERAGITNMINFLDRDQNVSTTYGCNLIPSYYLIGEDKRIICKGTISQMEEKLKSL